MAMTTKFIGIKEFRQHIAEYAKKAQQKKARYIIMNRNKPLFEIAPFDEDVYLESFVAGMKEAEADMRAGRVHTEEEILAEFTKK